MHVAQISRIGVDRACGIAVTGSDDKTVRVWSLPDGRLLRTLRVPIGPGNGGKIYATAISPDGRWIAAGGWDAQWDIDVRKISFTFSMPRPAPWSPASVRSAMSSSSRLFA